MGSSCRLLSRLLSWASPYSQPDSHGSALEISVHNPAHIIGSFTASDSTRRSRHRDDHGRPRISEYDRTMKRRFSNMQPRTVIKTQPRGTIVPNGTGNRRQSIKSPFIQKNGDTTRGRGRRMPYTDISAWSMNTSSLKIGENLRETFGNSGLVAATRVGEECTQQIREIGEKNNKHKIRGQSSKIYAPYRTSQVCHKRYIVRHMIRTSSTG